LCCRSVQDFGAVSDVRERNYHGMNVYTHSCVNSSIQIIAITVTEYDSTFLRRHLIADPSERISAIALLLSSHVTLEYY